MLPAITYIFFKLALTEFYLWEHILHCTAIKSSLKDVPVGVLARSIIVKYNVISEDNGHVCKQYNVSFVLHAEF